MPDQPVEPTVEAIQESQISGQTAAQAAAAAAGGPSATSGILAEMQKLSPAKDEPSMAQRASGEIKQEPAKEKKEFPKVGTSDIKEEKQVESRIDEPAEQGSALEGFREGLIKNKRAKQRKATKEEEAKAEPVEESAPAQAEKTEVNTEQTAEAAKADDDVAVTEDEIQKTINDPSISKRHQKRMVFLANRTKELETKLKELETKPQSDANDAKITELNAKQTALEQEVIRYRRLHSLPDEPEIKKFDEVIGSADEAIGTKLKDFGLSDNTLKLIKDMGGFDGFSRSNQPFTIEVKNEDGETVKQQVTAAQLAKNWLASMNAADAEYVRAKMGEKFVAQDNRGKRSKELTAEAETWFKTQQAEQSKVQEQQKAQLQENQKSYNKWAEDWASKQEWLKDKPVPISGSEEEKADAKAYNNYNAGVKGLLKLAANPTSVQDYTTLVEHAATAAHLRREEAKLKKENEALKSQLAKIQKGVSTTNKPGSSSIQSAPKKTEQTAADQLKVPVADSLREAMERLRGGGE